MLFKRIYKDMVAGRLTPERFDKLSAQYEEEQKEVRQVIGELQSLIDSGEQEAYDLQQFLKSVQKYTDPEEHTAEMLNSWLTKSSFTLPTRAVDTASRMRFTTKPLGLSTSLTTSVKPETVEDSGEKIEKQPEKAGP